MSIKKFILFSLSLFVTQNAFSEVPVEVIASCKNGKSARPSVTLKNLTAPAGLGDDEPNCMNHFESNEDGVSIGSIICDDQNYLIINKERINLNTAINHSINPSVKPGADIDPTSEWYKIIFNEENYLCINVPLSSSGDGANISQYYIVENAFNQKKPILNYYFFNKEVSPISSNE